MACYMLEQCQDDLADLLLLQNGQAKARLRSASAEACRSSLSST